MVLTLGLPRSSTSGAGFTYTVWEMRGFTPLFSFSAQHIQDVRFTQGFLLATVEGSGIAKLVWSDHAVLVGYGAIDSLDDFALAENPGLHASLRANSALRQARYAVLGRDGPDGLTAAQLAIQAAVTAGALIGYRLYNVFSGQLSTAIGV